MGARPRLARRSLRAHHLGARNRRRQARPLTRHQHAGRRARHQHRFAVAAEQDPRVARSSHGEGGRESGADAEICVHGEGVTVLVAGKVVGRREGGGD